MGGGPIIVRNKIGCGYAAPVGSTGVDPARGRGWRNFAARASSSRRLIDGSAEMAEKCHSSSGARSVVAWMPSHGAPKGGRSQRLELHRRLIAGLTAPSLAQLLASARRVGPRPGASPFRPAPGPTRVASASRRDQRFSAVGRPFHCLKLRLSQTASFGTNGSGPEAGRLTPKNGVRGAGAAALRQRARNRSAGRENGAEAGHSGDLRHVARAPFVERTAGSYVAISQTVNCSVQTSVENRL